MNVTWPAPRTLVAVGIAVVLLAAASFGGWYWYDMQQRRIGAAYAEVMTRAYAAQTPQATTDTRAQVAHDLEELIARHPSGPSAAEAAYELGNLRYAAQQYAAARSAYELAIARGASPTVRTLARVSVGYTWEAERNFPKAVDAYQTVARDLGAKDFLYEQTLLDLARAQELAGRPADAITTYQRLLKDLPAARRADDVRARLVALGAPAPAAPVATSGPGK
ncbi:MAG TPA: tetratricopeptide repeat protein [Methylomirabilota bacterium]|nr:tetratricopeptide repeat protein [Methylomirabilota bacterium]